MFVDFVCVLMIGHAKLVNVMFCVLARKFMIGVMTVVSIYGKLQRRQARTRFVGAPCAKTL